MDTLTALFLPFTTSIFIHISWELLLAIPDSLYYSARVDGANNWRYLWRIMVPMQSPPWQQLGFCHCQLELILVAAYCHKQHGKADPALGL